VIQQPLSMLDHRECPSRPHTRRQKARGLSVSTAKGQDTPWKNSTNSMVILPNSLTNLKEEDMLIMLGMRKKLSKILPKLW